MREEKVAFQRNKSSKVFRQSLSFDRLGSAVTARVRQVPTKIVNVHNCLEIIGHDAIVSP